MWALIGVAWAMPRFVAGPGAEADVLEAPRVWAAAMECVGRDAKAHDTVTIRRVENVPDGFAAVATSDHLGLREIALRPRAL